MGFLTFFTKRWSLLARDQQATEVQDSAPASDGCRATCQACGAASTRRKEQLSAVLDHGYAGLKPLGQVYLPPSEEVFSICLKPYVLVFPLLVLKGIYESIATGHISISRGLKQMEGIAPITRGTLVKGARPCHVFNRSFQGSMHVATAKSRHVQLGTPPRSASRSPSDSVTQGSARQKSCPGCLRARAISDQERNSPDS